MIKQPRFKVGDKVTYKDMKDCTKCTGEHKKYYYGGYDQGGAVGEITHYSDTYVKERQCWKIKVTTGIGDLPYFNMLECEFLEYDKQSELFPIY